MASNTTRFGLLKKDPVVDALDTFNIKTILNDNWDKIDTNAETIEGAQEKANTAKSEAISTAATDATNKANTAEKNAKDASIPRTEKGVANGVATLGSNGVIPEEQIPKGLVAYTQETDFILKPSNDPSKDADIGSWITNFSTFSFTRKRGYMEIFIDIDAQGVSSDQSGGVVYGNSLPYRLHINGVLKSTGTGSTGLSYRLNDLGLSVGSTITIRLDLQNPTSNETPSRRWLQGSMGVKTNTVFQTI